MTKNDQHTRAVLARFGLTVNETLVYLTALQHADEELGPYQLAKLTAIPRTTIYEILMSLSLKGLVTLHQSDGFTKQQTRITPNNPSELRAILWQKRRSLVDLELDVISILPRLKSDYHGQTPNADFQFFPGIEGARKVYFSEDTLDVDLPIQAFENLMPMDAFGMTNVNQDIQQATQKRLGKKYPMQELITFSDWSRHVVSYQFGLDPNYLVAREMRFIDRFDFLVNQRIAVQGSHLRIATVKDNEVWGLLITSPSLAQTILSLHQLLWQQATPVTPALIASWGTHEFLRKDHI